MGKISNPLSRPSSSGVSRHDAIRAKLNDRPIGQPAPYTNDGFYQHVSMDRSTNRPVYEKRTVDQLPPQIQELMGYQKQQNLANVLRAQEMGWGKYAPEKAKAPRNDFFTRFNSGDRTPVNVARSGYAPKGRNPQTTMQSNQPQHGRAQWSGQRFRTNTEA